jgi:hypothetical protein
MASLDRNLRRGLENAVKMARRVADAGARQVLEQLAVNHHEPWPALTPEQRKLRNRLRAHGRQLGDRFDEKKGTQALERLAGECGYEHWHRLLFARFLAENDLLVEPDSGMALSLEECRELARERGVDWLVLASAFAQRMLPQIFRAGDPVLEVTLPPETRQQLEGLLEALPRTVFLADDSLGWVYQFWQADEKVRVNASEKKIGADELPAVTQLFTEDYMVLFLLHNTLGAWWAGRILAARPELGRAATGEQALRDACAVGDQRWEYLRFAQRSDGVWAPAAGEYETWPLTAKQLTLLDPSMGSGHFLVFALPILCAFRIAEEGLAPEDAVDAVLRDNLFGLELDARCTQIAAFNLALTAWRITGHRALPRLNLACSGLAINARESEWLALAGDDVRARGAMKQLHSLFQQAPVLGSLIDPSAVGGELFVSGFSSIRHLLEQALRREGDETRFELAVAAQGVSAAAELLVRRFTLVITNVPYLGRGDQDPVLAQYCEVHFSRGKADLATSFLERTIKLAAQGGSLALVSPQNWLFLKSYKSLRENLLRTLRFRAIVRIGEHGFESAQAAGAFVALSIINNEVAPAESVFAGVDAAQGKGPAEKAISCRAGTVVLLDQAKQRRNPDARLTLVDLGDSPMLSKRCESFLGLGTGDFPHYGRCFWEVSYPLQGWTFLQSSVEATALWSGREHVVSWDSSINRVRGMTAAEREQIHNQDQSGQQAWGKIGVAVGLMRELKCTLYTGEVHEKALAALIPDDPDLVPVLWALCSSREFYDQVRKLDNKVIVANGTLVKIPFDATEWEAKAKEMFPAGLPAPVTNDPTQWIFDGNPAASTHPLQVAVARLCGYRWPRQRGVNFWRCDAVASDALIDLEDEDGIVCTQALHGESPAAERVRAILAASYGASWSAAKLAELLQGAGAGQLSLDEWLRDRFFEQHCDLFHQSPFIWHVSDGLQNGFNALVNYHKLIAPADEGRRTLEKLIYTYLGDWIDRQRAEQKAGAEGADARVAAADHLKRELERILEGEPPYDIFVRWKPLSEQPVGWAPDVDDGVRVNIRPFMMAKPLNARGRSACILRVTPKIKFDKDRGKDSSRAKPEYPWLWGWDGQSPDFLGGSECDGNRWNDLHYSRSLKIAARERAKGGKS